MERNLFLERKPFKNNFLFETSLADEPECTCEIWQKLKHLRTLQMFFALIIIWRVQIPQFLKVLGQGKKLASLIV